MHNLKKPKVESQDEINAVGKRSKFGARNRFVTNDRRSKRACKYCDGSHDERREACPAYGETCKACGRKNHFARVCLQKGNSRSKSTHAVTEYPENSDDSGESVMTLDLVPQTEQIHGLENQVILGKIYAGMQIKGGKITRFQVDTGATCNVIRLGELQDTKY